MIAKAALLAIDSEVPVVAPCTARMRSEVMCIGTILPRRSRHAADRGGDRRMPNGDGPEIAMSSMEQGIRTLIVLPKGWRTALGAISMLWIATALGAGLVFLTQALLAHELGP